MFYISEIQQMALATFKTELQKLFLYNLQQTFFYFSSSVVADFST